MTSGQRWVTADGQWRVTCIELDRVPLLKAEARGALGWIWRGNFRSLAQAQAFIPGTLREAQS